MSRGRIFHRARTDISIRDTCRDDSLIMAILLVDASGSIMIGGLPTLGRACAWVIRSCTICRAAYRLVPDSNVRSIADRPGIDDEEPDGQRHHEAPKSEARTNNPAHGPPLPPRRRAGSHPGVPRAAVPLLAADVVG